MTQVISKLLQIIEFYETPTFLVSTMKKEFVVSGYNSKMNTLFESKTGCVSPVDLNVFCSKLFKSKSQPCKDLMIKITSLYENKTSDPHLDFFLKDKSHDLKVSLERLKAKDQNLILVQFFSEEKENSLKLEHQQVQLYEKLFESLPIGLGVTRIDDDSTVFANQRLEEIYGWPIEDLQNVSTFFEKVYPDKHYREKISKMVLEDIASGEPERMNWKNITITTKEGEQKIVNAKNIPLYDENLMISTVLDMTDSFKAQKDLQTVYERLDKAFKATSDALWEWELSEDELYWGDGYDRLFGYHIKNNKVSKTFWESKIHPGDFDPFFNSLNAALEDKSTSKWSFIYRFLNFKNEYANVRENVIIIRNDKGEAIRLVGAIQDITKAIKRESHLNLLEKLVANARDAILVTEVKSNSFLESEIIYANPSSQSLFGFKVTELIGETAKSLFVTSRNVDDFSQIEEELSQWESVDRDILSLTKDNKEFWNNIFISPIMDDEGWYTHWMIVNRNVNQERTNAEKQDLLNFAHKAFQDGKAIENSFCKVSLKMEDLFRNCLSEFWLKDPNMKNLEKCFRFKNGESLGVDLSQKNTAHQDFVRNVLSQEDSIVSLHKHDVDKNVKLNYGFRILDQDKPIGVVTLGFPDTYSEKSTLDKIFKKFSIQLSAELSRKFTEFRISSFFSNTPDILFIIKQDNCIRRINKRASDILGYSKEEFFATSVIDFVAKEDQKAAIQIIDLARNKEGYFTHELTMVGKNGTLFELDWTVFSLKESKDIFCVARDITDYKANLRNLKTQNEKFRIINETVKDAIWDFDLVKNEIEWGSGLQESFGYDPNHFGKADEVWSAKIHADDKKRVLESFSASLNDKKEGEWRFEYRFQKKDGTYVHVLDRGKTIRDENGKAVRAVGSMQDISELKSNK
jgi:PAS domain S-box-containing protein